MKNRVHELSDGTKAVKVYVFPKYTLSLATTHRRDMLFALKLALAQCREDIELACADPKTGSYHLDRHMYLKRTFVAVHVRDVEQGPCPWTSVVDDHKHYMVDGQSMPCSLSTSSPRGRAMPIQSQVGRPVGFRQRSIGAIPGRSDLPS